MSIWSSGKVNVELSLELLKKGDKNVSKTIEMCFF